MTSSQKTLIAGCLIGLVGSGVAVGFARYQQQSLDFYGSQPQAVSVATLIEQGHHGPRWIELTNWQLGPRAVVSDEHGRIEAIRLPVFPRGQTPTPIHVVLRSTKSRNLDDFSLRLVSRETFRGALLDAGPGDGLRKQLAAAYPGQPLADQICELDIDFGGPPFARWSSTVQSASAGLLLFGIICMLGFIGSSFARKDDLPVLESVPSGR
ncbi:MAG TPA: hypothetical protein VFB80_23630 [Pirellulaceae bacterium]|nr:hypothetical protein [Pirellulaceae bacterium]